ncbi:MAG: helix-turn-helix domain-containing protein [Alphaproteobacteria bacterium]|nr:helix-turn-helix domain-containing protein [Alphaproteobacteria bacterium]
MKPAYTIQETIDFVPFGLTKLYQVINSGKLPAKKFGRKTIILRKDLEQFLADLPTYPSRNMEDFGND